MFSTTVQPPHPQANVASIQGQGVTYGADSNAAAFAATVAAGAVQDGSGIGGVDGGAMVVPGLKMLRLGGSVSYAELRGVTRSYAELRRVTRSYAELRGVTRS